MRRLSEYVRGTGAIGEPSTRWLSFFRINVALFALFHYFAIQPDFADFFSLSAYVYPDILDATYRQLSFTVTSMHLFLREYADVSYDQVLSVCRFGYPTFLILLALGILTRVTSILALFFQLLLLKSIHLYQYGVDFYTTIALFYCCVFPVGRVFALDQKWFGSQEPTNHQQYLNLLRWHLSIAYFFSGFGKIIGETWRNGEAIWKTIHAHNYYSFFNLDFLADTPFFLVMGWATIVVEMLYPIGMNNRWTRRYWLIGILSMHVFIALFMGLFFFSALLIILNLSAYFASRDQAEEQVRPIESQLAV